MRIDRDIALGIRQPTLGRDDKQVELASKSEEVIPASDDYIKGMSHAYGNWSSEVEKPPKINTAYGSRPDDYADTGLVEPPKVNTAYGSRPDDLADTGLVEPELPTAYGSVPDDLADTGLVEPERKAKEEGEIIRGHEIIENIRQFYLDKANTNMDIEEFKEKYPYGSQMMQAWKDELTDIIGEERTDKLIDSWSKIEEGRDKQEEEIEGIKQNEQTSEEKIGEALQTIVNNAEDKEFGEAVQIAQSVIEELEKNGGLTSEEAFWQKESFLSSAPVYVQNVDGNRVEMEVLTDWSAHPFGGEGTEVQRFFENAFKIAKLLADAPNTTKEIVQTAIEETIEALGDEAEDYFNSGKMLGENDVRISIQRKEDIGTRYKYNYFFRDGVLILVTNQDKGTVWSITDE